MYESVQLFQDEEGLEIGIYFQKAGYFMQFNVRFAIVYLALTQL